MSVEKSFTEFMVLHEKKIMSKDVNSLEKGIIEATDRSSSLLGNEDKELREATDKLMEGISMLKRTLAKHHLYEIK